MVNREFTVEVAVGVQEPLRGSGGSDPRRETMSVGVVFVEDKSGDPCRLSVHVLWCRAQGGGCVGHPRSSRP